MTAPTRTLALLALAIVLASGCPRTRTPVAPDVPRADDPSAEERFQDARAKFEAEEEIAAEEFDAIAREFPNDPIAPYARLYAGMSAVTSGAYDDAIGHLEELESTPVTDRGLELRGALFLGVAYTYQGAYDEALPRLTQGEPALTGDDERGQWLGAMAEATAATGGPGEAIGYYDAWHELASAAERAYILDRISALAGGLADSDLEAIYQDAADYGGPAAAIVGERYATSLEAEGALAAATDVRRDIAPARRALELPDATDAAEEGDAHLLGAVVPLSGARARVGDLVMRGIALASGTFSERDAEGVGRTGIPKPFAVALRDSRSEAAGAVDALEELVDENAIAVLGPVDASSASAAAASAERRGLPLVTLSPRAPSGEGGRHVFHVVHSAEERARSLARYAFREGKRDFAIFAPDNGYGRAVGAAFKDEVESLGAGVTVEADYPADATSFVDEAEALRGPWDALFVPDQARRLELVAPALAANNMISTPADGDAPRHGRGMLLLSTAEFLSPSYVRSTGRYSVGAVFAPGFYPDQMDPDIGAFVDRYESTFGRSPTALDAYAYDAALAVRAAVESGARTRAEVRAAMLRGVVSGVTGRVGFDSARQRDDEGVLFRVDERARDEYEIRALRE